MVLSDDEYMSISVYNYTKRKSRCLTGVIVFDFTPNIYKSINLADMAK